MENQEIIESMKKSKPRSRLYPRYDLEEAIKFIDFVANLGRNNVSEKSVAAESKKSITNSGFLGRVSSAKQFSLISKDGGKLSLTQFGNEIAFPSDHNVKTEAIKKAFAMPTLYRELIEAFNGTKIPEYGSLANILLNDYGIEAGAKDIAAKNFIKSAGYARVLQNGILIVENTSLNKPSIEQESKNNDESISSTPMSVSTGADTKQINAYHDSGDGWMLTVKSTRPLTSEIKKRLIDITEFFEHGVELNK